MTNVDPSGHDFTTTDLAVTAGIAGLVGGVGYGEYRAHMETGNWLSWKSLEYGAAYGAAGFTVGAAIGAIAGDLLGLGTLYNGAGPIGTVVKIAPKVLAQLSELAGTGALAGESLTLKTFVTGAAFGVAAGIAVPNQWQNTVSFASLTAWGGNTVTQSAAVIISGARNSGLAQLGWAFMAGFNVGYFTIVEACHIL